MIGIGQTMSRSQDYALEKSFIAESILSTCARDMTGLLYVDVLGFVRQHIVRTIDNLWISDTVHPWKDWHRFVNMNSDLWEVSL
jgi:hypothetical protein